VRRAASIRFSVFEKPWPSSAYSWYWCGAPVCFSASTICMASLFGTIGSFAPCSTSTEARIILAWVIGERSAKSVGVPAGSPSSRSRYSRPSLRVVSKSVWSETIPELDTPAAKRSGCVARASRVMYPP